ncbi:MAG TPA: ABC transporter substrate-binding protein [Stellaceae bacterium]|nr:ABC transporter substrate-binding protein [Stellaceae bacterium]
MIARRSLIALLGVLAVARAPRAGETAASALEPIHAFYDVLLGVMKEGQQLGFAGRRDRLAPTIRRTFDFPLMTRLMVGQQWAGLSPEQQQQLVASFSAFSIATYANRFDDYSGEEFKTADEPTPVATGDTIVKTQLVLNTGETVELDYLMRVDGGRWQAIDVYLSGTVSELATRRSEFSSIMRRSGPDALVEMLQRKVAELSS